MVKAQNCSRIVKIMNVLVCASDKEWLKMTEKGVCRAPKKGEETKRRRDADGERKNEKEGVGARNPNRGKEQSVAGSP